MKSLTKCSIWFVGLLWGLSISTSVVAASPTPVDLGVAGNFAILSGSGISNVPFSAINGNVGVSPSTGATIVGFDSPATCPEITGTVYSNDGAGPACAFIDAAGLILAKAALTTAYNDAAGRLVPAPLPISGDLGGTILAPGIYKSVGAIGIGAGNLILDGEGDVNAVWIFQIGSAITTVGCGATFPCATGGNVLLVNGAHASNIYWQVGTAATIGQYTAFEGTILAHDDITMNTGARISGRLLSGAQLSGAGAVTLISNTVAIPHQPGPIPTLSQWWTIFMGCALLFLISRRIKSNRRTSYA